MELEWLVFFPGKPSRNDWKRLDASARIVRAGLQRGSVCHLLFEDRICISLSPDFLGGTWDGTEASYERLLKKIVSATPTGGASFKPRGNLPDILREMLRPVDVALDFRERGAMMLGLHQEGSARPRRALCVIGGVKDLTDEETGALIGACAELRKRRLCVSLGLQAELTSKCMKAGLLQGQESSGPL